LSTRATARFNVLIELSVVHLVPHIIADRLTATEPTYDVFVGATMSEDAMCAPQLEVALATVLGLLPEQLTFTVNTIAQAEVNLSFGVYERLLAQKLGAVPPIQ
jgi:hypothetical protein